MMQPYTARTCCNFDSQNGEYSDGRIASKLFQDIAIRVIKYQETATVEEKKIRNLISQCKGEKVWKVYLIFFDELWKLVVIINPYTANENNIVIKSATSSKGHRFSRLHLF